MVAGVPTMGNNGGMNDGNNKLFLHLQLLKARSADFFIQDIEE